MEQPLVNRVAKSGLVTLDLEDFYPTKPIVVFDLVDYLFKGLILKEKDFRTSVKTHDWSQYDGKIVLVQCSSDAIIPVWAYMLIATSAAPFAADIFQGDLEAFLKAHYKAVIDTIDLVPYREKRIVVKGCGDKPVPPAAYLDVARKLYPIAKSIMYGEPCSTVPIFKQNSAKKTSQK